MSGDIKDIAYQQRTEKSHPRPKCRDHSQEARSPRKAEAEAKARVVNSEAEAKAILVKAEAEAKAIELKNAALASSHALIEYETVKTWDGKLPVQMLGSTPIPFIKLEGDKK